MDGAVLIAGEEATHFEHSMAIDTAGREAAGARERQEAEAVAREAGAAREARAAQEAIAKQEAEGKALGQALV